MLLITAGLFVFVGFTVLSLRYVYASRGVARFDSLTEYLRKGWPLFAPLNCLLYLFTEQRAARPIMNMSQFPELSPIADNWTVIRDEAVALLQSGAFDKTNSPDSDAYYDLGFRTFYKYGWSKFYLKWYGHTHNSAKKFCPKTLEILNRVPSVNGAMFSVLPPGGQLTRHLDPVACSLRYHLGLMTPNSDNCFINVDTQTYAWRDGQAFVFDETYLHFVKNNTDSYRLILMCDVERPMHLIGRLVNFIYKGLARLTVVPNMEGDKRGLVNATFSSLAPALARAKALKQTNRPAYLVLKYSVNILLMILVLTLVGAGLKVISSLF
jgi:beta-hydroxylase